RGGIRQRAVWRARRVLARPLPPAGAWRSFRPDMGRLVDHALPGTADAAISRLHGPAHDATLDPRRVLARRVRRRTYGGMALRFGAAGGARCPRGISRHWIRLPRLSRSRWLWHLADQPGLVRTRARRESTFPSQASGLRLGPSPRRSCASPRRENRCSV